MADEGRKLYKPGEVITEGNAKVARTGMILTAAATIGGVATAKALEKTGHRNMSEIGALAVAAAAFIAKRGIEAKQEASCLLRSLKYIGGIEFEISRSSQACLGRLS